MKKIIKLCQQKPYIVLFLIYIFSVLPMIYLGLYLYPQADDFAFSGGTHNVWIEKHSLVEVIKNAVDTSVYYWETWAGTFSSVFLFSLQPEAFIDRGYVIVPFLFISLLSGSAFLFINTIMKWILKQNTVISKMVAGFTLIYIVWNVPDACQAFYWYNGASHYTVSFSLMLITSSLLIRGYNSDRKYIFVILSVITSIMVGGGNFVSALTMAIIYFFYTAYLFFTKQRKKYIWLVPTVVFYMSFILNIIAPGNAERQAFMGIQPDNPIQAVIHSFVYAINFCFSEWMNVFLILLLLIMIPFVWNRVDTKVFDFRYPGIVIFISFCIIAAMFTPTAYAEHGFGPGRVRNIIFCFYIILFVLNEVYLLGYVKQHICETDKKVSVSMYAILCVGIWLFLSVISYKYDDDFNNNTFTALSIIKNGQAKEYAELVGDNMNILNSDDSIVTIHKVVEGPVFFYSKEIDDWKSGTKAYFGKELIQYEE